MERKNNQLTFLDNATSNLGGKRTAEFFAKCDKFIPWDNPEQTDLVVKEQLFAS